MKECGRGKTQPFRLVLLLLCALPVLCMAGIVPSDASTRRSGNMSPPLYSLTAPASCSACDPKGTVGNYDGVELLATVAPVGNPTDTLTSLHVHGQTQADNKREFLVTLGLESGHGAPAPTTPQRDKVTLYTAISGKAGTGDIWSINPLCRLEPDSGDYNAQGIELDFDNLNEHRGEVPGGAGLAQPSAYGFAVTGGGTKRSTSAMMVSGPGDHRIWNRGLVFANDCVQQSTFQDHGSPDRSIDILGNPKYAIYQASTSSINVMNGKVGVGTDQPTAALDVRGDVAVGGVVKRGDHTAVMGHGSEVLSKVGRAILDGSGASNVVFTDEQLCHALQRGGVATYTITAVGGPMPNVHIAKEATCGASSAVGLGIAGGLPSLTVTWSLTVTSK